MAQPQFTPLSEEQRKARHREYCRIYREKNRELVRVTSARWQAKHRKQHPEKVKESLARWRAKNKNSILEYKRGWKAAHRVEETLAQQARHTKTKVKIDKTQIINWENRICGICKLLIKGEFHIDHITPISKGGPHTVENLQLAHPFCNLSKKDKLLIK